MLKQMGHLFKHANHMLKQMGHLLKHASHMLKQMGHNFNPVRISPNYKF
jgi:hypothetical protein